MCKGNFLGLVYYRPDSFPVTQPTMSKHCFLQDIWCYIIVFFLLVLSVWLIHWLINLSSGILLYNRSLTSISTTLHRHLSSARFFADLYMLLINCSLFLPLVRFSNILPSSMSLNSTSWRRTWPSHLRFRCLIVLTIQRCSITLLRTSELLTFAIQLTFPSFAITTFQMLRSFWYLFY